MMVSGHVIGILQHLFLMVKLSIGTKVIGKVSRWAFGVARGNADLEGSFVGILRHDC
jgi:hypothetical protein